MSKWNFPFTFLWSRSFYPLRPSTPQNHAELLIPMSITNQYTLEQMLFFSSWTKLGRFELIQESLRKRGDALSSWKDCGQMLSSGKTGSSLQVLTAHCLHVVASCIFWLKTGSKHEAFQSTPNIAQPNNTSKSKKPNQRNPGKSPKRSRRMAAMAVANYKRRIQQQQQQASLSLQESQDQASTNFKQQQSSQSNVSEQGCFSSARPTTNFTGEANPNGTKKWSCDADGVTINTKWFPSSTSR